LTNDRERKDCSICKQIWEAIRSLAPDSDGCYACAAMIGIALLIILITLAYCP